MHALLPSPSPLGPYQLKRKLQSGTGSATAARSGLPPTARALYRFCRHCRVHPPEDVWVLQRRRRRPFRLRGPRRPGRPFLLLALHVDSPRPQPTLRTPESHTRPSVPQGRMTGVPERAKEEVDGRGRGGRETRVGERRGRGKGRAPEQPKVWRAARPPPPPSTIFAPQTASLPGPRTCGKRGRLQERRLR